MVLSPQKRKIMYKPGAKPWKKPKNFVRNPHNLQKPLDNSEGQGYMRRKREYVVSLLVQVLVFRSHWGEEFSRGVERMPETREVMDIREASEYLGVSRETLYKYVYEDKIPAFKLGNRWKFKKTLLDRWMETQSAQSEHRSTRK